MDDSCYTCPVPTTGVNVTGSNCAGLPTFAAETHILMPAPYSTWPLSRDGEKVTGLDFTRLTTLPTGNTVSITTLWWASLCSKIRVPVICFDVTGFTPLPVSSPPVMVWSQCTWPLSRNPQPGRATKVDCADIATVATAKHFWMKDLCCAWTLLEVGRRVPDSVTNSSTRDSKLSIANYYPMTRDLNALNNHDATRPCADDADPFTVANCPVTSCPATSISPPASLHDKCWPLTSMSAVPDPTSHRPPI